MLKNYLKIGAKPGKIPELDGIRALAVIMILLFHFATFFAQYRRSYYREFVPDVINQLMTNAWLGVDLFFVLSGFLIFNHLLAGSSQMNNVSLFGRYALKRVLRTFPLYYAMILIIVLGLIPYYQVDVPASDLWIHLFFLQDYFGSTILVPFWSLATEEKFYLLAPFLLLFTRKLSVKQNLVMLGAVIVILTGLKAWTLSQATATTGYSAYFNDFRAPFHYAIIAVFVGVMVAMLMRIERPKGLPKIALLATVALIAVFAFMDLYRGINLQVLNLLHLIVVVLFGVIVWCAVAYSGHKHMRFLCGRGLRIVAVLSYALYLAHYAVLPQVTKWHKTYIYPEVAWIQVSSFFAMYLITSVVAATILHYLVEKPFLILKDRVE